jgi:glycine/D-amino acid oxidase-like deaminating enzyme/nitrite reductase/ring-hydroxylating ferredoxin subunit
MLGDVFRSAKTHQERRSLRHEVSRSLSVNAWERTMSTSRERTRSIWMDTEVAPQAPMLDQDLTVDTVIVGSGIAGLSTAYELALEGRKVVVLDRGPIAGGITARTTAHLTSLCDDSFKSLIDVQGLDAAKQFYESQAASIDRIEKIQNLESIDCDFRRLDGFLFPAPGTDPSELDANLEADRRVGIDVEDCKGLPFEGLKDTRCLRYRRQGTFHPLKYLQGIAAAIQKRGGKLFAETCMETIEETNSGVVLKTRNGRKVNAGTAVIATNSPVNDRTALHTKQAPYRTYAMAFRLPRNTLPDALYWDTLDEYHYVRLHPVDNDSDALIVGGADHKSGEADDADVRFEAIAAWMRNLVPKLGEETHRWSGQVMETIDYMSFTGLNPGNQRVYVHTGDSGQGITHGVVASLILSELILTGESRWADAYHPSRKTLKAARKFVSENITAVKNFAEYVAPGEIKSLDELQPGHGAIVRDGLTKIAAYRDEAGKLFLKSAACTHLGCHVHWNSLEQCWDCPCHGSHFAVDGTALNGPAISPLGDVAPPRKR